MFTPSFVRKDHGEKCVPDCCCLVSVTRRRPLTHTAGRAAGELSARLHSVPMHTHLLGGDSESLRSAKKKREEVVPAVVKVLKGCVQRLMMCEK